MFHNFLIQNIRGQRDFTICLEVTLLVAKKAYFEMSGVEQFWIWISFFISPGSRRDSGDLGWLLWVQPIAFRYKKRRRNFCDRQNSGEGSDFSMSLLYSCVIMYYTYGAGISKIDHCFPMAERWMRFVVSLTGSSRVITERVVKMKVNLWSYNGHESVGYFA